MTIRFHWRGLSRPRVDSVHRRSHFEPRDAVVLSSRPLGAARQFGFFGVVVVCTRRRGLSGPRDAVIFRRHGLCSCATVGSRGRGLWGHASILLVDAVEPRDAVVFVVAASSSRVTVQFRWCVGAALRSRALTSTLPVVAATSSRATLSFCRCGPFRATRPSSFVGAAPHGHATV